MRQVSSLFDLSGKVAIVTGAAGGLGAGMAAGLAGAGADIVLVDRKEPLETATAVRALGRENLPIAVNPSLMPSITSVVAQAIKTFVKIDILINNAGIFFIWAMGGRKPGVRRRGRGGRGATQVATAERPPQ